jgi:hypothetical protein
VNFSHVPKFEILDVTRLPPPPLTGISYSRFGWVKKEI